MTQHSSFGIHHSKVDTLYEAILAILENARSTAYRAVNFAMIQAYWQIGYLIVEYEQGGKDRAEYGGLALRFGKISTYKICRLPKSCI